MGKKVMRLQASLKITKQKKHESNKKQLNSLIEVLRPKVYITDSSNFKRLVQELTSNGSSSSSTNTMPSPASPGRIETVLENNNNNTLVIDIIEDDGDKLQASMEAACSFDASMTVDSFDQCCHNIVSYEGFGEEANTQMYLNEATLDISLMNQLDEDWLAYQDLESWLLDIDQPCPSFNGIGQNQEVSIYDYELSALI